MEVSREGVAGMLGADEEGKYARLPFVRSAKGKVPKAKCVGYQGSDMKVSIRQLGPGMIQ